jgi:hypothetical protein
MSAPRLNASVEAAALIRRAQSAGDFAALLHKGDSERGAILLVVRSRGAYVACLERALTLDGDYSWARSGPEGGEGEDKLRDFLDRRARFDQDSWLIELDVAQPERFIAETTSAA